MRHLAARRHKSLCNGPRTVYKGLEYKYFKLCQPSLVDTLKFVETLKEAGVPETQAKAFSTAVRESHEAADVATKGDIVELCHEMDNVRHEISDLRKDMDTKFEKTESTFRQGLADTRFELLKWMIGLAIAQVGLMVTILKFLS